MGQKKEFTSRPVRIRLKKTNEVIDGNIIFFDDKHTELRLLTDMRFRVNDTQKTERLVNLMDVDIIHYL